MAAALPLAYQLNYPPEIVFGWGALAQLPEVAARAAGQAAPPYVLAVRRSLRDDPLVGRIAGLLGPARAVFAGVPTEPTHADVDALAAVIRQAAPAVVIAVGGGSVMDTAKAAAFLAGDGGACADYAAGRRPLPARGRPFIALPTTSGSGAEITRNAVLTALDTGVKQSLRHPRMIAAAALVDPELTVSAPPGVTAASGLDALTQAVESYLSTKANAATQALARQAVVRLYGALPRAWRDGQDRAARTALAEGSLLGALAFSQSGLGAVHGLAHPVGTLLHRPHGYVCAVLLPHLLRFNAPAADARLGELATAVGLPDAAAFVAAIGELCRALGIPPGFAGDGLAERHFPAIVAQCRSPSMACNPRPMSDAEVLALLHTLA